MQQASTNMQQNPTQQTPVNMQQTQMPHNPDNEQQTQTQHTPTDRYQSPTQHESDNMQQTQIHPKPDTTHQPPTHHNPNHTRNQKARALDAFETRVAAARIAYNRPLPDHRASGDEQKFRLPSGELSYIGSFTKGLRHDARTGLVRNPEHFEQFVRAVDSPDEHTISTLPLGPGRDGFVSDIGKNAEVRGWESMGAGCTFDLQGPDAQAVTMPPAPALLSQELHLEMAEAYWMALLRDVPLSWFSRAGREVIDKGDNRIHKYRPHHGDVGDLIKTAMRGMNRMPFVSEYLPHLTPEEQIRKDKRPRFNLQNVFRGITPGDDVGPYLSQFIIAGTPGLGAPNDPKDGFIQYGAMRMDQRTRIAEPARDYMTNWASFLDVQNGADVRGADTYDKSTHFRFISTGRDLATYVHHDALYQSYLNACLCMLALKVPFDKGLPFGEKDRIDKQEGFAQFGGPHILTLLTEVATRALKAVRYQKFNNHRRLRPEAVGGILDRFIAGSRVDVIEEVGGSLNAALGEDLICKIIEENRIQNEFNAHESGPNDLQFEDRDSYALLPMAFPEGSPMHPSYGSGHATVGGACVTILKAFFEADTKLPKTYVVNEHGTALEEVNGRLTVEGELNKLCSNIAIGRSWAGVHYFSDYYESILLGERVALGILEEQMLLYTEKVSMTVPLFDGTTRTLSNH